MKQDLCKYSVPGFIISLYIAKRNSRPYLYPAFNLTYHRPFLCRFINFFLFLSKNQAPAFIICSCSEPGQKAVVHNSDKST